MSNRQVRGRSKQILGVVLLAAVSGLLSGTQSSRAHMMEIKPESSGASIFDTVDVYIGHKAAPAGAVFSAPIYVKEDVTSDSIMSCEFTLVYNPSMLSFRTAVKDTSFFPAGGQFLSGHDDASVFVAMGSPTHLEGKGILAKIEFRVATQAEEGQTATLYFERFLFNEPRKGPIARVHDGLFTVGSFPDIELGATGHDFGNLSVGDFETWELTVSNVGYAALSLLGASATSTDFSVSAPSFPVTVAPGADATLTVRFSPVQLGPRSGTLTITSNDYYEPEVSLSLTGVGIAPDIALSNREHSFGQITVGYTSEWEMKAMNLGNAPLTIDSVLVYPTIFRLASPVFPQTVAVGETLRTKIKFTPAEIGQAAGVLTFFSNDPDEETIDVFLSGIGLPAVADILIGSTVHDFGGVYLGNAGLWPLLVSNVGTGPLVVSAVTSNREELTVASPAFPQTVNPAGSIEAVISFLPESEEQISGTITVVNSDPDEPAVIVALSGYGLAPVTAGVAGGSGLQGSVANQVPVKMANSRDVASMEFVLNYLPDVLTATAAIPTERSEGLETFQVNTHYGPGQVKVTLFGQAQTISAGSGDIAKIAFQVASDAVPGEYPLTSSDVSATDVFGSELSFVLQDSVFSIRPVGVNEIEQGSGPAVYALSQNYPNPFNPATVVSYQIPVTRSQTAVHTTLKIYNFLGQEVATLVDELKDPGYYTVTWDAGDMASGVYLCRLTAGTYTETKRMVLMK